MKKKKGGKGLSVLSGRELYNYRKDLFKDQDEDDYDNGDNEIMAEDGVTKVAVSGVDAIVEKAGKDLLLEGGDDDLDDLDDE